MVVTVIWIGVRRNVVMTANDGEWRWVGRLGDLWLEKWPKAQVSQWRVWVDIPDDVPITPEGQLVMYAYGDTAQEALDELDAKLARVSQWIRGVGT